MTRAEKAAQRVLELEERIADLYVHFNLLYSSLSTYTHIHMFPLT